MNIIEKADKYADGKANEAITKAIAQAYLDGYRDGYNDREAEIPADFRDSKTTYIDLGLPSRTLWSEDYEKNDGNILYLPYERAEYLKIPTGEQWAELRDCCQWEWKIDNAHDFCWAKCIGPNGNILLGNSGTSTNNHLDVLEVVSKYKSDEQDVIIPLNYGDPKYIHWLRPRLEGYDATPLYDFLPRDQYFSFVKQCSYCCFGVIRQQAMGNISFCLREGLKVFLYRDSVVYKGLKTLGFVVFAIEEIDENSFKIPLTEKEMRQNLETFKKEVKRREDIHDKCMQELLDKFQK